MVAERIFEGLWVEKKVVGKGVPLEGWTEPDFWEFGWKWSFSKQIMYIEYFKLYEEFMHAMKNVDELGWRERNELFAEWRLISESSGIKQFSIMVPAYQTNERALRERRALLRTLRAAAHWRATGEVLELGDPFGRKILHVESAGSIKIWSVGKDGVDNGGSERNGSPQWDIVIELKRAPASGQDVPDRKRQVGEER